jgi:hypothetical protein
MFNEIAFFETAKKWKVVVADSFLSHPWMGHFNPFSAYTLRGSVENDVVKMRIHAQGAYW